MRSRHPLFLGALVSLAPLTIACNSVLGIDDVALLPPDATMVPDAARCDVMPAFSLVTSNSSTSILSHISGTTNSSMLFLLNTDAKPDSLGVLLYDNKGGHAALNAVGTYTLTASDSRIETCGLCAVVNTDYDSSARTFSQTYWAVTQGTLTLTKADSTGMAGRIQNLKFRHVNISSGTTADVNDGCAVRIDDVRFDMPYSTTVSASSPLHAMAMPSGVE
jgi:hypothetical protein